MDKICKIDGCGNKIACHNLCDKHYRGSNNKKTYKQRKKIAPEKRFWKFVTKSGNDGCWNWTGGTAKGYGAFSGVDREQIRAHRFSYELHNGAIPDELCVLHKCDNRLCVNPDHLFLGTLADNIHDACSKGRNAKGVLHGRAKLTDEDIINIREDNRLLRLIASDYGVKEGQVSRIKNRLSWGHI